MPSFQRSSIAVAYQVVTHMTAFEGQLIWQKIQAFLICNSLIGAAIAAFRDSSDKLRFAISFLGLATCSLWWPILARAWDKYHYWLGRACALEEAVSKLCPQMDFFIGHRIFSTGGTPDGTRIPLRLSKWGQLATTKSLTMFVIVLFTIVYGYFIVDYVLVIR